MSATPLLPLPGAPIDWDSLSPEETLRILSEIVGKETQARAVISAVKAALSRDDVVMVAPTVGGVIGAMVRAVVSDAAGNSKTTRLLRRFIEYGGKSYEDDAEPDTDECGRDWDPDRPVPPVQRQRQKKKKKSGDPLPQILSDAEGSKLIDLIFSHMVSRFKGDLAELLALPQVLRLLDEWRRSGGLSARARLYWGDTIRAPGSMGHSAWLKAADGLVVEPLGDSEIDPWTSVRIRGLVEVKSMEPSGLELRKQFETHLSRLAWGLRLAGRSFTHSDIVIDEDATRLLYVPSGGTAARNTSAQFIRRECIRETHAELEEAGYSLTAWNVGKVGVASFGLKVPKELEGMSAEKAAGNNILQGLYHLIRRPITDEHRSIAVKIYNILGFGYHAGVSSSQMRWPGDPEGPVELSRWPRAWDFTFDRLSRLRGWKPLFSWRPPSGAGEVARLEALPAPLDARGLGYLLSGTASEAFLAKRLEGLVPKTEYNLAFRVGFASNRSSGRCIKGGATTLRPAIRSGKGRTTCVQAGEYGRDGADAVVLEGNSGDVGSGGSIWRMQVCVRGFGSLKVKTDERGRLWVFVGAQVPSGSCTATYYRCLRVALDPVDEEDVH